MQIMRIIKAIVTIAISADGYRGDCNFFSQSRSELRCLYVYNSGNIPGDKQYLDKEIII